MAVELGFTIRFININTFVVKKEILAVIYFV